MSNSISIDITTFDLTDENKVIQSSNTTSYDMITWPDMVGTFVQALRGAGFYPNYDDFCEAASMWFHQQVDHDCCELCENNPENYEY